MLNEGKKRPLKTAGATLGVAAVLGIAAVIGTMTTMSANAGTTTASPDVAWAASSLSVLADDVSAHALPSSYTFNDIDMASVRYVAEDDVAQYWTATSADGRICLLTTIFGKNDISASSCVTGEVWAEHGAALQAATIDGSTRAYLLPDGTDLGALPQGLSALSPNLAAGDPYETVIADSSELRSNSESGAIALQPFGIPDDYMK